MKFLVQDLLDYAQIKSGKFRQNIENFNIREAVEKVMCIQRLDAIEKGIEFIATFNNIAINEAQHNSSSYSPTISTDMQRVM